jgi:hypothetical protein
MPDSTGGRLKPLSKVQQLVAEIIELADHDALDLVRSRKVEQAVLDIIDGRKDPPRHCSCAR